MPDQGDPEQLVRRITERLTAAGWGREQSAVDMDWPDFEHRHGEVTLQVFHPPGDDWITVSMLTEDQEGHLKVVLGARLDEVMDVVTGAQDRLDPDTWPDFIEDLLAIPVTVYSSRGEDGSDLVELKPLRPA